MRTILRKLYEKNDLSPEDLLYLLDNLDKETEVLLYKYALLSRLKYYGRKIYVRGLIEFSSVCKQHCMYCGLRSENTNLQRYRLTTDDIYKQCCKAYTIGYRTFVLQSGEDPYYTDDKMVDLIKNISRSCPEAAITLSLGEKSYEAYKRYHEAGADRYLLRHEAAVEQLYKRLHPAMDYEHRMSCIADLKQLGYQTGAGFIVGLPGQGNEELVEDLLFLKRLQPEMTGIGPFIPAANTPLSGESGGTVDKTLQLLAIVRLLVPETLMPVTTALLTREDKVLLKALQAGTNVIMFNITPETKRGDYKIYEDKQIEDGLDQKMLNSFKKDVAALGFEVTMERGDAAGFEK